MLFLVIFSVFAAIASAATEKIFFPSPSGQYHVGKTQHVINHTTPNDPIAPKKWNNTGELILLTIHYPTERAPTPDTSLRYLDNTLARELEKELGFPKGSLQKLWTTLQWQPPIIAGPVGENKLPTLIFGPGLGTTCSISTMIQAEMASRGYTVLCLDHPGEMPYLKLPYGGGGLHGLPLTYDFPNMTVFFEVNENRKSDMDTLLEFYPKLVEEFGAPFNTSTYIHYGFSLGGSLGSYIVSTYDSVLGGVNYDGSFIDFLVDEAEDVKKPFLLFRDGQVGPYDDETWPEFEGNQTGWWEYLQVKHSHHLNFSDMGFWFELLGLKNSDVKQPLVGKITGTRMLEIQTAFTTAFFDKVLGKKECLLEAPLPSKQWPDVVFVNSSSTKSN
jgi:hypothetical protein